MKKLDMIRLKIPEISDIAQKNGVIRVQLFGSLARGEEQESSDVDLLITMAPGRTLLDAGGFQYEVERLLGYKVDIVATGGKNKDEFIRKIEVLALDLT